MKTKYFNIAFVLVFLFIGINFASGNNKHFYNPVDGGKISGNTQGTSNDYKLFQNYPNPFNPATNIRYSIKENGIVTIKIYDILGKEIATLVNEKQSPGMYEVTWDASQYSSGIYFYKLTAGEFSEVKKMILIK
jgi:flagellar hook assembly protein FlgD